jgi:hypothetical protein
VYNAPGSASRTRRRKGFFPDEIVSRHEFYKFAYFFGSRCRLKKQPRPFLKILFAVMPKPVIADLVESPWQDVHDETAQEFFPCDTDAFPIIIAKGDVGFVHGNDSCV